VGDRVRDDVADRSREVARIRPGDRGWTGRDLQSDVARPSGARRARRRCRAGPRPGRSLGPRLERRGFRAGQVADVGDDAAERGSGRPGRLEVRGIGRDDAVDHRLELGLEDGRRRREVVGDVARRAASEHLRPFQPIGHGVERIGQLGRLAVVATARAGGRVARSRRRAASATSWSGRVRRPAIQVATSTMPSTLTIPATAASG
jgi:hypothetical protein